MSDALVRAKDALEWDISQGRGTSHSPDERTIPALLSGILAALTAIAERLPDDTPPQPHQTPRIGTEKYRGKP